MFDYFVDHALKNVWCTPNQDMQSIVKPRRLTPFGGAWNSVQVLWRTHQLPVKGVRFHVYQIGQLHPLLMGLFPVENTWTTLATACNLQDMIVDVYANSGIQMPRTQIWYMVTADKNLILAVQEQLKIAIDLNTDDLFVRVYSNAFFNSAEADRVLNYIEVVGRTVVTTADILDLQTQYLQHKALTGETYAFVNGLKVSGIDLFTAKPDDVVEFVYDSSIMKIIDFPVKDLISFVSTLDGKHKYLLHYAGDGDHQIDYQDDIDAFLYKSDAAGRSRGVYYHRNQADAIRMVTHKDYSVPVPYVLGYTASLPDWQDPTQLTLRLHIRKSGYSRQLVDESNRIKELYKLPDADLMLAMVGANSNVSVWKAAALEDSAYAKVMRSNIRDVSRSLVEDAYGYNAISKLLANTPMLVAPIEGTPGVHVPHGLFRDATAYEYDANGKLLGWFGHPLGTVYVPYVPQAAIVEMIVGPTGVQLDEVYGDLESVVDANAEYRMYVCPIENGHPNNKWVDVTGTSAYSFIGNVITWLVDRTAFYTLVRGNRVNLGYDMSLMASDGLLRFSLMHQQSRGGQDGAWVMQIPMGELDIFLNGYSLVEDLDYVVNFPEVVIINKTYLQDPLTQKQDITIRFSGFCNANFTHNKPSDVGFIKYRRLSDNNRFDIRDDKVMRIVAGGRLVTREALLFAEQDAGVTVLNADNGKPYVMRDIVVPLRGLSVHNTYELRAKALRVDQEISDYMSMRLPEPIVQGLNVIEARHELFSPFCCKIIYDLKSGVLDNSRLKQQYNDNDVVDLCRPYEFLLKSDPTQEGLRPDDNYVTVHPHNLTTVIDVDIYQYKFITRVVKLYLKDAVELAHFLRLSA